MRPQIESGEYKVVTRDNHPAKILCWDAKGIPIVALVREEEETDIPYSYNNDGSFVWKEIHDEDLFVITQEPELTEFEKFFAKVLDSYNGVEIDVPSAVAVNAPTLLELARKELQPKYDATKVDEALIDKMAKEFKGTIGITAEVTAYIEGLTDMYKQFAEELDEAFKHQDDVVYNEGYDKGREEALKGIPRWKRVICAEYEIPILTDEYLISGRYKIMLRDLNKLPKDDE